MQRWTLLFVALILTFSFSHDSIAASKKKQKAVKKPTIESTTTEALLTLQAFYPVNATQMGVHDYDGSLVDYSPKSVTEIIKKLETFHNRFKSFTTSGLSPRESINFQLVRSNVEIALQDLKTIGWYKKSPQHYVDEAVNGVYSILLTDKAQNPKRLASVLSRMRAVPKLFATASVNIKNPPAIYIELAKESLESGIEFYKEAAESLIKGNPKKAKEIRAVSDAAREAMSSFMTSLSAIKPGPEKGFAIGESAFDYKLAHEYFLSYNSDSLLAIGEELLKSAREDYSAYETYIEENKQNGQDSVFTPAAFNKRDILDYYGWEVDQVKLFIQVNDLITVPDDIAPIDVVETPSFLRSMVAGIAYQPAGAFDLVQQGYFYVRPVPDSLDRSQIEARYRFVHRRGFKGSVVHEAFPGHHLQMQIASAHPDPIRKWQANPMMIEGWALYCEEMMYNAGLFGNEDPAQWLAILGGIRFRAARIVADVKLHTGQFTYSQCVDWMVDVLDAKTDAEKDYLKKSVRKYTLTPTVWMSYLVGKQEIENLRDAMSLRDGDGFSEREFYDQLLAEASIPPALMWQALSLEHESTPQKETSFKLSEE
ncbi:MAG: DUF885 domain-containing protein [candidate division Zixibacteria bacterium]|nr:DUF885 domain-containing protein [candidate division Zixibacteria bacterium]